RLDRREAPPDCVARVDRAAVLRPPPIGADRVHLLEELDEHRTRLLQAGLHRPGDRAVAKTLALLCVAKAGAGERDVERLVSRLGIESGRCRQSVGNLHLRPPSSISSSWA